MKTVIITAPMKPPKNVYATLYPIDGNKAMEYQNPVRCPINAVLAKTMEKNEEVKVIYILTTGENSLSKQNMKIFIEELENINKEIGAVLSYDKIDMDFLPTKQTYNKLITDLAEKIDENAEIFTDITFGHKPEILSLFCSLRFVEEFRDAVVQYIVYGKVDFNKETHEPENPMLYDITSLYYLFKLIGNIGNTDSKTASKMLNDFFAL